MGFIPLVREDPPCSGRNRLRGFDSHPVFPPFGRKGPVVQWLRHSRTRCFFGIIATKVALFGGNPRQTTPLEPPQAQSVAEHRPRRATDKAALCHRRVCASGRMPPCSEVIPPRPTVGPVTRPHGAAAYPTTATPGFWGSLPLSLSRAVSLARFGSPLSRASALSDTCNPYRIRAKGPSPPTGRGRLHR